MKKVDTKKRHIKQFLKVGRIGKAYYVFGAPDNMEGPYDNVQLAEKAYNDILDDLDSYQVVDRKVVKK